METGREMETASSIASSSPLSRLRRFTQKRSAEERCELCGAAIGPEHSHLLEPGTRQLHCACEACSILFSGDDGQHFRRVTRRITPLPDMGPIEGLLESLQIPINLAFFYYSTQAGRMVAMYPSPAGATESLLATDQWDKISATSQMLRMMQSDVEALLINRVGRRRDVFIVSIDECYRLVGIIRSNWRGLSGGRDVWEAVTAFFDELHRRARGTKGREHA